VEVIGRCGGDEKTNDHAELTKSRTLIIILKICVYNLLLNELTTLHISVLLR